MILHLAASGSHSGMSDGTTVAEVCRNDCLNSSAYEPGEALRTMIGEADRGPI